MTVYSHLCNHYWCITVTILSLLHICHLDYHQPSCLLNYCPAARVALGHRSNSLADINSNQTGDVVIAGGCCGDWSCCKPGPVQSVQLRLATPPLALVTSSFLHACPGPSWEVLRLLLELPAPSTFAYNTADTHANGMVSLGSVMWT